MIEDDEAFRNDLDAGLKKAIEKISDNFMSPKRALDVHDRANEARVDFMDQLPGGLYRLMKADIAAVWGLLESPIEQVAIFQLAGQNYSTKDHWPIYVKVCRERGKLSHKDYPVQLVPQVQFGRYRVDFLIDLGPRGLIAVECDGEEFHQDADKDHARDRELREEHGVFVIRMRGKDLWWGNEAVTQCVEMVKLFL